jgi:hypothetical protein
MSSGNLIINYVIEHRASISVGLGWVFSAICASQPPLRPDAGYYTTWFHDIIQAIAANLNKLKH